MKALKLSALTVVLLSTAAFADDQAQVVTKEAQGEAAIIKGDLGKAKDEATKQALREAVVQAAGLYLTSDTVTQNSLLVSDKIYANAQGYVKNYSVTAEKQEGGVERVTVKADIVAGNLDKDLASVQKLVKEMGNKKLLVMVNEQTQTLKGATVTTDTTATALTDAFRKDGWRIIDPAFAAGKVHIGPAVTVGAAEAKEISKLTDADYIVYGSVAMAQQPPDNMMGLDKVFAVTGEYDLTVFASDTGDSVAKISGKFGNLKEDLKNMSLALVSYEHTAKSMLDIRGKKIASELRQPMVEHFRDQAVNGNHLVVKLANVEDYDTVLAVTAAVQKMNGVHSVGKDPELRDNKADIEVVYAGSSGDLAKALRNQNLKQGGSSKKVKVTGVTANTVELKLQ